MKIDSRHNLNPFNSAMEPQILPRSSSSTMVEPHQEILALEKQDFFILHDEVSFYIREKVTRRPDA